MKDTLYNVLASVLGVSPETISDATSPENTPSWDSFNSIMMIVELEKASGVKFAMEDVMKVKNVADIKQVLTKYGVVYEC
jgi:acyl carrier protein